MLDNGRKKINRLHSVINNRDINLSARRLLLLSVEYGSEVWEGTVGVKKKFPCYSVPFVSVPN